MLKVGGYSMTYEEFRKDVAKIIGPREHKITGSIGVYSAYKWIRKNKWPNIPRPLTEHEFYKIIRTINNYLAEELLSGHDIVLPHRMGRLELRKYDANIRIVNGKVVTNLPIDWDRTLKLWYEDKEAYNNKTLVKMEEKEIFRVYYNRNEALYTNKSFYTFNINRDLKQRIKKRIKEHRLDAFKI